MQSEDNITTLYRGYANSTTYVWSPFVTKLEFRFRYSKLPYRIEPGSPGDGPKGKVPYVDISALSATLSEAKRDLLADSTLIIKNLVARKNLEDLNEELTPVRKAMDLALRALFEERLYFLNMAEKWIDNFYIQRDGALQSRNIAMRYIIGLVAHRRVTQTLHLQGSGRFSAEEQRYFREEIWQTLEEMLLPQKEAAEDKSQPFWCLGGRKATEADAVIFAFISTALVAPSSSGSASLIRTLPATMDYADRIHNNLFSDYVKWRE